MPLSIGARVGPYEVLALLGAGGMGEVFRGHDPRLRRDVALKVLPTSAMADADRRARFAREAQVLAALDHPHLAKVFGIEDAAGSPVIVMELVEGPTLAELLTRGPLPIDDALALAVDLAQGLAAAHDAGVVHRDLKPANIKVRPDGVVKILDFGLAAMPVGPEPDATNSPTVLEMRTMPGAILGTAAYMSPEQARGKLVDARADLWAFGCVLFEMLAGRAAFAGDSTADILAAVVRGEPDWAAVPAEVPARAVEVLRRCLEKSARDRQRSAADAADQLQRARRELATPRPLPATAAADTIRAAARPRWWLVAASAAAGAAIVAASLGLRRPPVPPVPAGPPLRTSIALPRGLTLALGRGSAVAISPDGQRVVFAGRAATRVQLYRRDLSSFESVPLPGTENATNPFFSPDGRWVGFFADRTLKKVAIDGGAPVTVGEAPNPRGEAWGDGDLLLVTPGNSDPISQVSAGGGRLAPFSQLQAGEASHRWPHFLPDGRGVLFSVWNDIGWEPASIHLQRRDGGRSVVIERNGGYARYVRDGDRPEGFLVFAREGGVMAARFDEVTGTVRGSATPIFDGLITNLSGGAHFDLSDTGSLAYVPGVMDEGNRDLVWVTLDGKAGPPVRMHSFSSRAWRLAPDGRRVLHSTTTGSPTRDLWVKELDGSATTRLSQGIDSYGSLWSRDGREILYLKGSHPVQLVRREARADAADQVVLAETESWPLDLSPDGRWMLHVVGRPGAAVDLMAQPLPAPGQPAAPAVAVAATPANDNNGRFSPDGRWIAYQSGVSGRQEIYVKAFPAGDRDVQVSASGGTLPEWAPSGREIFFRSLNNVMMAVAVTPSERDVAVGQERRLFDASRFDTVYAVAPDGKRLLMMPAIDDEADAIEIRLISGFLSELRARVP